MAAGPRASLPAQPPGPVVLAEKDAVSLLEDSGAKKALVSGVSGVRAALLQRRRLLLGRADGSLISVALPSGRRASLPPLEDAPSSPVTGLLRGPGDDTVVVGSASGQIGLWDLTTGARLAHGRVHGAAVHLMLEGQRLHAVSELGDMLTWDLSAFYLSYEDLLRRVLR